MKFESKKINGILIVELTEKRLDAKLAVDFRLAVDELINQGNHVIALDMRHIEFIDSSGLGAIVTCLKLMGSRGKFVLFGLTAPVIAMFKLTRMDRVFSLYANEEQALEALQP